MLISYKSYKWVNPKTGKKPVLGDEFLYHFDDLNPEKKMKLLIQPSVNPIKKHPIGFTGLIIGIIMGKFLVTESLHDIGIGLMLLFMLFLYTGVIFSFISYTIYFIQEKRWIKQVIINWKDGRLKYNPDNSEIEII